MQTFAIKDGEKILVTPENKDSLVGYEFIQEENPIESIKQRYKEIILGKYSLTDQLNMNSEVSLIMAVAQYEQRQFIAEELARLNEIKEAKTWIDSQRELCSQEIQSITQ